MNRMFCGARNGAGIGGDGDDSWIRGDGSSYFDRLYWLGHGCGGLKG